MTVQVTIIDGPVPAEHATSPCGAGAAVLFRGIVRELEQGRPLQALEYEAYEPMAQRMLQTIAEELMHEHGLLSVHVIHSRGRVAVGACSFYLAIASPHRKEALAAMDAFIDQMKQDVPIWKKPIWRHSAGVASEPASGPG